MVDDTVKDPKSPSNNYLFISAKKWPGCNYGSLVQFLIPKCWYYDLISCMVLFLVHWAVDNGNQKFPGSGPTCALQMSIWGFGVVNHVARFFIVLFLVKQDWIFLFPTCFFVNYHPFAIYLRFFFSLWVESVALTCLATILFFPCPLAGF